MPDGRDDVTVGQPRDVVHQAGRPRPVSGAGRSSEAVVIARVVSLALFVTLQGGWLVAVATAPDPATELLTRDWSAFFVAGQKLLAGQLGEVYPVEYSVWPHPRFPNNLPYLYPPFSLYLTVPLGALPPVMAWVLCWVVQAGSFGVAMVLLGRLLTTPGGDVVTPALIVGGSAVLQTVLILGQISATLLLGVVVGLWAWQRGRPFVAGLVWSCLLVKPNWGLPLFGVLLLSRHWRVAAGGGVGALLLGAASLPLGLDLWPDWMQSVVGFRGVIEERIQLWRQLTLYAFWRTVTGWSAESIALRGIWLATALPLVGLGALAWVTVRRDILRPRLLGLVCLIGVSANPYCYFYDGLLLALPALVWWWCRATYPSRQAWEAIGVIIGAVYVWLHFSLWVLKENGPTIVGPLVAVWVVLEATDLLTAERGAPRQGFVPSGRRARLAPRPSSSTGSGETGH